jgi:putative hydrolase of the HAD superfamily
MQTSPKLEEKSHLKTKALLFDLGYTLINSLASEAVFCKVLGSFGIQIPVEKIREALARTENEFGNVKNEPTYGKVSYEEFWNGWDSRVLRHLGLPENKKVVDGTLAKWFDYAGIKAYSEVKNTLCKVKQMGLKTGIISDAYEEDINLILEKAHLKNELFDIKIGANTIKKIKPHPDVFKYALSKLYTKPNEALFIGDAVETDYKGAEKVGIKAILIQRKKEQTQANLRTIRSLEEIFNFID